MVFPDGAPLICNIMLNKEYSPKLLPSQGSTTVEEALFFNASSNLPKALTNYYNKGYAVEFIDTACLKRNERLFISNLFIDKLEAFGTSLVNFYTHEWGGMCEGQPNNLLD